jgi:translation initiation factor 1
MFEMGAKFQEGWSCETEKEQECEVVVKTPQKHQLTFAKEKRKGKIVTIVKPFYLEKKALKALLATLKKSLATGGSIKENTLEFQGDVKEKLLSHLRSLDFRIKG